jgi:filamentous hemagglutinin
VFVGGWTDAANDASQGEYGPAVLGVGTALFKPAKSVGKIWSGTKDLSPVKNAFEHWRKHRAEFPELQNSKQYVEAARSFFAKPPAGTQTFTRPNGDRLFYDRASNTFGVQTADGVPRTMFRPDDGYEYWLRVIGQ